MVDVLGRAIIQVSARIDAGSVQSIRHQMARLGKDLTFSVTAPLAGLAAASLKTFGSFEQSMNVLQAATSASADEISRFEQQAKDLGRTTTFSANEAAEAMVELGKAGLDTTQIMKSVPEVINLAATEGLDLASAAGAVASALKQFNLDADESATVVNALAGAAKASLASVTGLSTSLSLAGSSAANIGLSVQETAGALAALADSGLKGSIAGTSLASVFNKLVPQTDRARDAMKELGLDFTDSEGNFKSMEDIAGELSGAFKGMSEEARKTKLSAIFGADASVIAALNALISTGAEGLKRYTKAAKDQGAAQELAEARTKGLAGALEKMKESLTTAGLAIGETLAPKVIEIANAIGAMADAFSGADESTQIIILALGGVAAAIGPLLIAIAGLGAGISALKTGWATASASMNATRTSAVNLGVAFGQLRAQSGLLNASLTTAKAGFTSMSRGAKLAAGAGGIIALQVAMEKTGAEANIFADTLGGALQGALGGAFLGPIGIAAGALAGGGLSLFSAFNKAKEAAKQAAAEMEQIHLQNVTSLVDGLTQSLLDNAGAWDISSRKAVFNFLQTDEKARAAVKTLENFGVTSRDIIDAQFGNAQAQAELTAAWDRASGRLDNLNGRIENLRQKQKEAQQTALELVGVDDQRAAQAREEEERLRAKADALDVTAQKYRDVHGALTDLNAGISGSAKNFQTEAAALGKLKDQLGLTAQQIKQIPKEVRIKLRESGVTGVDIIKNTTNAKRALDDLTRKERRLVLRLVGASEVNNATGKVRENVEKLQKQGIKILAEFIPGTTFRDLTRLSKDVKGSGKDAGAGYSLKMAEAIIDNADKAKGASDKTLRQAAEAAKTTAAAIAPGIGQAVVQGFAAGLVATPELLARARQIARDAEAAARAELQSQSPSKKFIEVGKDVVRGFALGLESDELVDTMRELVGKLREAGEKGGAAIIKAFAGKLGGKNGLANQFAKVNQQLEEAKSLLGIEPKNKFAEMVEKFRAGLDGLDEQISNAQGKLEELKSFVASTASSIVDSFALTSIDLSQIIPSQQFQAVLNKFTQARDRAVEWAKALGQLQSQGLSNDLLLQFAQAGPAALEEVKAILGQTGGVQTINQLAAQIATAAQQAGDVAVQAFSPGGVAAAESFIAKLQGDRALLQAEFDSYAADFINGLKSKRKELQEEFENLAEKFAKALIKAVNSTKAGISLNADKFAHGTTFAPGGLALVGEQGPELVTLPRGSQVRTASETRRFLQDTGEGQRSVTVNQNFFGPTIGRDRVRELEWSVRYAPR